MGLKVTKTVNVDNTKKLKDIIDLLKKKVIRIGLFGKDDSFLVMVARVSEFGCEIYPKNCQRLCVPVNPQAVGRSARSFTDLFFLKDKNGQLWLCKKTGKDSIEFYYWLPTKVVIPERSFIRGSYNEKQVEMQKFIEDSLQMLFSFQIDVDQFCKRIGQWLTQITQQYAIALKEPPKSWASLSAYPGKTNPLVISGHMVNSITYSVNEK